MCENTISTSVYALVLLCELFILTVGRPIQATATTKTPTGIYCTVASFIYSNAWHNSDNNPFQIINQAFHTGLGIVLQEKHRDFSLLPSASASLSPPTLGSRYSFPDAGKAEGARG